MDKFKELVEEMETAKIEADKFFINDNMQAGKRYFASLMRINAKCKSAREELSDARKNVREQRNGVKEV